MTNLNWLIKMAWRDSRRNRGRLLLFTSSIIIGIAALVGIPPGAEFLAGYVPRQAFLLADFGHWSDAELHRRTLSALGRIALVSLRDARTRKDLVETLLGFRESLSEVARQPTGLRALERVFRDKDSRKPRSVSTRSFRVRASRNETRAMRPKPG